MRQLSMPDVTVPTRAAAARHRHPRGRLAAAALLATLVAVTAAGCTAAGQGSGDSTATAPASQTATSTAPASPDAADPDAPPAPTPAIPAYTVEQLRTVITDSGYACATFTPAGLEQGTGGWCQESMIGIFVFPDDGSLEALLDRSASSAEPQPFLVGNRWVVTVDSPASSGDELVALQDVLGGDLVGPNL